MNGVKSAHQWTNHPSPSHQAQGLQPRQQAEWTIHQLLNQGQLLARGVRCIDNPRYHNGGTELAYQRHPPAPRPGTLLWGGRRIMLYCNRDLHLGLASFKPLYLYKKDVGSSESQSAGTRPRLVQTSLDGLRDKMDEQDNRLDSLYRITTSGRMGADGRHISGHEKLAEQIMLDFDDDMACVESNELISTGYRTEHYRCVLISHPSTLHALYQQLEQKCRLEQELAIAELPLVFYQPTRGAIRDIIFVSEWGITESRLPQLKRHIDTIQQFSECVGSHHLWQVIALLPPKRLLAFLCNPPIADLEQGIKAQSTPYRDQLRTAVEQGDMDRVRFYYQNKANLRACYHYTSRPWNTTHPGNLLDVLKHRADIGLLGVQTYYRESDTLSRLIAVGKFLYDHGCRIAIDRELVEMLPALAAYMISRGEHYHNPIVMSLLRHIGNGRAYGTIDRGELNTLVEGLQRDCVNSQDKLNDCYTLFLAECCHVIYTDTRIRSVVKDLSRRQLANPLGIGDNMKILMPAFARCGVVADTGRLRQYLYACGQNERIYLDQKRQSDVANVSEIVDQVQQLPGADSEERLRQLTKRVEKLYAFKTFYDHSIQDMWKPELAPERAEDIVQCLRNGDIPGARDIVEQLYNQLYSDVGEKEQAMEQIYQRLDRLQSLRPRVAVDTSNGGTQAGASTKGERVTPTPVVGEQAELFGWLRELFRVAPDTTGKSYRELAQLAIDHYYRMPHPDQAVQFALGTEPVPDLMKRFHGVEHVTRTQVLAEALLELFAQHDPAFKGLLEQQPKLWELIPLAMVYHDATAEVEAKVVEERRAAELFTRDMQRVGRYPVMVVQQVATALRHKESDLASSSPSFETFELAAHTVERHICRILRLADRIDIIRATSVPSQWNQPRDSTDRSVFNYRLLDLPDSVSSEFRQQFDALLEGAKDLAYVTGGIPPADHSDSDSYLRRHNLQANNHLRRRKVTRAVNAYDSVITELDNNVRRLLAKAAGIPTCTEDHAKESVQRHGGRLPCLVERNGRDILTNIHSERELRQVQVPEQMTVAHKLMLEQMFKQETLTYLPGAIRRELEQEIERLKLHGIRPPLGTLTQEVLASQNAQQQLRQAYQLEVVKERRWCGGKSYDTVLVPRPMGQLAIPAGADADTSAAQVLPSQPVSDHSDDCTYCINPAPLLERSVES